MSMPLKKILFPLLFVALLAGAFEGIAHLAYFAAYRQAYSRAALDTRAHEAMAAAGDTSGGAAGQRDYLLDPYFGYVTKTSQPSGDGETTINLARSYGFDTPGQIIADYPDKVFTVAILGGSVAKYFAANMSGVLKEYVERLPQAKGRNVVIIGLGNYSYKQPQQLNIATDFLAQGARFDLVVNIDGFNEVAHPEVHNISNNVSPYFPSGWSDRTGEVASNEDLALLGEITLLKNIRAWAARFYERFGYGAGAGTVWSLCDTLLGNRIQQKEAARLQKKTVRTMQNANALSISPSGKISFGSHRDYPAEELYPDLATHWAMASALIHNAITSAGGKYYHFLQPNQYDNGSKPLSDVEKTTAYSPNSPYKLGVEQGYGLLRTAGRDLAAAGVDFIDTSGLFSNHTETLYLDDCCHYNKAGEEVLARAIGETIVKGGDAPGKPVSLEKLRDDLDASIQNTGKTRRLASVNLDLVADDQDVVVTTQGLWRTEKNDIRHFRWGLGPQTSITVWAPRKADIRLTARMLSATPDQVVTVLANGTVLTRWADIAYAKTATALSEMTLTFPARPGRNVIELRYGSFVGDGANPVTPNDPRHFAVMFQSLAVETLPAL